MGPSSPNLVGPIMGSLVASFVAAYAIAEGQMVYHFFGGRAPPHTNEKKWAEATRQLNFNKVSVGSPLDPLPTHTSPAPYPPPVGNAASASW
jgi:hypothetical protein